MSLRWKSTVVRVVQSVQALQKARQRKIPTRPGVTFFSENDVWVYDARADTKVCPTCRIAETIEHFRGNNLRINFPNLVILDENTIGGPEPGGGGLVHPNCRCFLHRVIGVVVQI